MLCSPVTHHVQWVQEVLPHVPHQLRLFSVLCWLASLCARGGGAEPSTASRQRGYLSEMTAAGGAGAKERVLNGLFRSDSLQSPLCAGRNRAAQITSCMHVLYICSLDGVRGVTVGLRWQQDSFNFNKKVELTAPVSLQSNRPIYPIRHL